MACEDTGELDPTAAAALLCGVLAESPAGVLVRRQDGRWLWQSPALRAFERQLEPGGVLGSLLEGVAAPAAGEATSGDGTWTSWRVRPIEWPDEGAVQLWVFEDVTEQVRTRRALSEAQGKLRLLAAHTRGILFEFDSRARFVRAWASNPQLLMVPEPELLGRTLIEALGPEVGRWHHERVCHTLRTGEDQSYEYRLEVPSGATNFSCTSVALPSPDGTGRSAVFWIRDITEEVELRTKLQRADRLAAVGTMAAGVAHEVNNPLAYMRLNLDHVLRSLQELCTDEQLSERAVPLVRPIEMIREGAERVHTIVSALLNLARATDANQLVDVRQTLERCLEISAREFEGRARVVREYAEVPNVCANENRLIQVFSNLLTNAAEAMSDAERSHRLQVSTGVDAKGYVVVEIRDTGMGIPREHLQRVFDPFFTTKQQGLGLGLAICQRIIASFGGEICAESLPGEGATFRVLLPAVPSP